MASVSKAGLIKGFAGLENFRKVTGSPVFGTQKHLVPLPLFPHCWALSLRSFLNNEFKAVNWLVRCCFIDRSASIWKFIIDTDYGTFKYTVDEAWHHRPRCQLDSYCRVLISPGKLPAYFFTIPFVTFYRAFGLQSIDAQLL